MITKKFELNFVRDLDPVEEIMDGTSRWHVEATDIYEIDGEYWSMYYRRAVGDGESEFFQDAEGFVNLTKVEKKIVQTHKWIPVKTKETK